MSLSCFVGDCNFSDIDAARGKLLAAGIEVSEIFHHGPNGPGRGRILSIEPTVL